MLEKWKKVEIKKLLDMNEQEQAFLEKFSDGCVNARISGVNGIITEIWNNQWCFISHEKGEGIFKSGEFKILPE